jgi:hypothetical protein
MERINVMVDISINGIPNGTGSANGFITFAGKVDRYGMPLRGGELYEFRANSTSSLDPTLTLRTSGGTVIASNDDIDGPNNRNSRIEFRPGTTADYRLNVAGFGTSTGTYQLVANEVPGNTSTYSTLTVGGSTTGDLHAGGDQDFHKVTLTAGHTYRFNMDSADFGSGGVLNPFLQLRNSAGTILASNIGVNDSNPATRNSELTFTPTTSGTYFANAQGFFGSSEFPNFAASGGYKLSATQIA